MMNLVFKSAKYQSATRALRALLAITTISTIATGCKTSGHDDAKAKGRHGTDGVQVGFEWVKKVKTKFSEIGVQVDALTGSTAAVSFSDPNSEAGRSASKDLQNQIATISENIIRILDQFELILEDGVVINADGGVVTVPENDVTSQGRMITGIRTVMTMVQGLKTDVKSRLIPGALDLSQTNPATKLEAFTNVQNVISGIRTTIASIQAGLATWPTQTEHHEPQDPCAGRPPQITCGECAYPGKKTCQSVSCTGAVISTAPQACQLDPSKFSCGACRWKLLEDGNTQWEGYSVLYNGVIVLEVGKRFGNEADCRLNERAHDSRCMQ